MKLLSILLLTFCLSTATSTLSFADDHEDSSYEETDGMSDEGVMADHHMDEDEAPAAKPAKKMAAKDPCKGLKGKKMTACKKKHSAHN